MIKEYIGTGKTVEDAIEHAKAGLNAPALADVNIEVIQMPKKKTLGLFGGKDAEVKAWFDDGRKEKKHAPKKAPKERAEKKPAVKKESRPAQKQPKPVHEKVQEKEAVSENISDIDTSVAVNYLKEILKGFGADDAVVTAKINDNVVEMEVQCEDYGIIIGRRGETLDSLQYLTSLALKRSCDRYVRVTVNIGNYREKRMDTLTNLAVKNANYVLRTGRRYTFEPMNPYERRIIHTAVSTIDGVESLSVGYGQERKVIIQPEGGVKYRPRRNSGYRDSSSSSKTTAPVGTTPKADRADLPKFGKIEINRD